jgi:hypothetical protein
MYYFEHLKIFFIHLIIFFLEKKLKYFNIFTDNIINVTITKLLWCTQSRVRFHIKKISFKNLFNLQHWNYYVFYHILE